MGTLLELLMRVHSKQCLSSLYGQTQISHYPGHQSFPAFPHPRPSQSSPSLPSSFASFPLPQTCGRVRAGLTQ